jgi:hypothetical protein
MDNKNQERNGQMTKRTARIAEDIAADDRFSESRLAAIANVKRKLIARHVRNALLDEWVKAK